MDKWIELVKAKMKELHITQVVLAERLGMSQGGIGHWLTKRRQPSLGDMNRVLKELGLEFLEVAMVISLHGRGHGPGAEVQSVLPLPHQRMARHRHRS
jgi:transcriptional regulator with XRE-family HTH domain